MVRAAHSGTLIVVRYGIIWYLWYCTLWHDRLNGGPEHAAYCTVWYSTTWLVQMVVWYGMLWYRMLQYIMEAGTVFKAHMFVLHSTVW